MRTEHHLVRELRQRGLMPLVRAVARDHGVKAIDLLSQERGRALHAARCRLWGILAARYNMSSVEIGRLCGRDHTSVLAALRKPVPAAPSSREGCPVQRRSEDVAA
ncbi:helix-turn-helix domain-containing protein [Sorangium sp. So ce119]|uniref:helix-turn-helix domain-containing protein n=1 Tax=Sorangium sp. So ce119 TaxID=3133279 RepID=UPI003F619E04